MSKIIGSDPNQLPTNGHLGELAYLDKSYVEKVVGDVDVPVTSVAGRIGDVELDKEDVGLAEVDNTSDADKPISDLTQEALNSKASIQEVQDVSSSIQDLDDSLATVAKSGDYDSLINKPTIPEAQVNANWNSTSGVSQILNKPTLGTAASQNVGAFATASQGVLADTAVQPSDLALYALTEDVPQNTDELPEGVINKFITQVEKDKIAGLEGSHYRGLYVSLGELVAQVETPLAGDYADVDEGVGSDILRYIWDESDNQWVPQAGESAPITASQVKSLYESNPNTNAFTDAQDAKLSGIQTGATANATNAELRNRATHTGTQAISTVEGLQMVLSDKANVDDIPTRVSELENDSDFISVETDPTVPAWAKQSTKPTYTRGEVGLGNVDNTSDLNKPISTAIQTALDDKADRTDLDNLATKSELFSGNYNDLDNKPIIPSIAGLATEQWVHDQLDELDIDHPFFENLSVAVGIIAVTGFNVGTSYTASKDGISWIVNGRVEPDEIYYIRRTDNSTVVSMPPGRSYIQKYVYWGDAITQLSNIGGSELIEVPNSLPKAITNLSQTFDSATIFNQDISSWATTNVLNMNEMFSGATAFTQDLSSWDGSNASNIDFALNSGFENDPDKHPMWAPPIHRHANGVTMVASPSAIGDTFYQFEGDWYYVVENTPTSRSLVEPFADSEGENVQLPVTDKNSTTRTIPLGNFVTSRLSLLTYTTSTTNKTFFVDKNEFNQDISSWDVSSVTIMTNVFRSASSFNQDISSWDVSSVTSMNSMFSGASSFNQDLSQWCVTNISSKPTVFDNSSHPDFRNNAAKQPQWGTCPRGEDQG